jgi:PAS domain S-box-containing protein
MCDWLNRENLNELYEGVYVTDVKRRIIFWNLAAGAISGYSSEEVVGRRCMDDLLVHVDECGKEKCTDDGTLDESICTGQSGEAKVFLRHKNGHRTAVNVRTMPVRNAEGTIIGGIELFVRSDCAERHLEELESIAFSDPLTGVANRRSADLHLARAVEDSRITSSPLSVILADINDFKQINDTYGHGAGDAVLTTIASCLRESVRRTDFVARWGGDEFLLVLPERPYTSPKALAHVFSL